MAGEGEGWLKGHDGGRVKVRLWVGPGGEGGLYVASWGVEARGREVYRLRMWIEEGFRDLKRRGLGWGEGLRREESVLGWAGLGLLAMGVLVWVGSVLRGLGGLREVLAHPERQSVFRLARYALVLGPPAIQKVALRALAEWGRGR